MPWTRLLRFASPLWLLTALAPGASAVVLGALPWWGALGLALQLALGAALEVGGRRDKRGRRRLVFAGVAAGMAIGLAVGAAELVLRAREQRLPRGVLVRLGGAPFAFCDPTGTVEHEKDVPWIFRGKKGKVGEPEPAEPELVRTGALRQLLRPLRPREAPAAPTGPAVLLNGREGTR